MNKCLLALVVGGMAVPFCTATAQVSLKNFLNTDASLTEDLTDTQEGVTNDVARLLRARKSDNNLRGTVVQFGGHLRVGAVMEHTSEDAIFPIHARYTGQRFEDSFEVSTPIYDLGLGVVGGFGNWVTAYLQYDGSQTRPNDGKPTERVSDAFVILGNPKFFGGYVAYGRKTVDFGEFAAVNPLTGPLSRYFFWTQSDDPVVELGYVGDNWRVSGTLMEGGEQYTVGYTSDEAGGLGSNWAIKAEKTFSFPKDKGNLRVSGSYLHGSVYGDNPALQPRLRATPPTTISTGIQEEGSVIGLSAFYSIDNFDAGLEYITTTDYWATTAVDVANQAVFDDARNLSTLSAMARYKAKFGDFPTDLSTMLSVAETGPNGQETEDIFQNIIGLEMHINPHLTVGAEYAFTRGFVPINDPQENAESDVASHAVNLGLSARF